MSKVNLLYFATIREIIGIKGEAIDIPPGFLVKDLKHLLEQKYPLIKPFLSSIITAVNKEYKSDDDEIPNGAEVAIFPPVSGGSSKTWILLTEDEIDINAALDKITSPTTGAICFFTGIVRGSTPSGHHQQTDHLVYEAYSEMAKEKMQQIAEEIRERWALIEGIMIWQRLGKLDAGIPTVLIACTASHRDSGIFEAAHYGIDRLKEIVPIWKKEVGLAGETWVEGDYFPLPGE